MSLIDVIKIQEAGLNRLDKATLKKLEPILTRTINKLNKELVNQSKDDFDYVKKKQAMIVIDRAIKQIQRNTQSELHESARVYNSYAIEQSQREIREIANYTPSLNRTLISIDRNNYLINRMDSSIDEYAHQTRGAVVRALQQAILQNVSGHKVTVNLQKFMDIKKWRVQRIARTELHNIYNASKILAYTQVKEDVLPDLQKALYHPMDSRTGEDSKALKKIHPVVDIDKPFVFKWDGKKRVFMNPPDRPNDRAVLIPYRENWAKKFKKS